MKLDSLIRFRVDEETRLALLALAESRGMTVSEMFRDLYSRPVPPRDRRQDVLLVHELGRVGNHLDRMARVLNASELYDRSVPLDFLLTLRAEMDELRALVERLEEEIVG